MLYFKSKFLLGFFLEVLPKVSQRSELEGRLTFINQAKIKWQKNYTLEDYPTTQAKLL